MKHYEALAIDHISERFYKLSNSMTSQYEVATHTKRHNPLLYIN
jgi:hypothetical protein